MNKLINQPSGYVDEALDGLCAVFPEYRRTARDGRVIVCAQQNQAGCVGVATGGGFGHLPLFAGYVGPGLLSACAVGNVFAGPSVDACSAAIHAADQGAGVLCVLGNYGGDRMSFAQACEEYEEQGGHTRTVVVADDVASAPFDSRAQRRGVAGMVFSFKIAGAAAARGDALDAVAGLAARAAQRTFSIGVALSPCTIPGASEPGFSLPEGQIEIGMGIHGEAGIERRILPASDVVTGKMVERLLAEPAPSEAGRVAVLVNSLGATPLEELLIIGRKVAQILGDEGLEVARYYVGHYATSMEMAGASISLLYLDAELEALLQAPAACPFWPR